MEDLLGAAAARSRPTAMAETRRLEVAGAVRGLFPDGGIQRGVTLGVGSSAGVPGSWSLALAVAGGVMAGGSCSWAAAVGFPSLGLVAASELGVPLDRLALVPAPGDSWPVVAASLLDGVDLVMLCPPARVRPADARRLAARVRERGSVMMVVEAAGQRGWPESPEVRLDVESAMWVGLDAGCGTLRARRVEVALGGRRVVGGRGRRVPLWLPGPGGGVEEAGPTGGVPVGWGEEPARPAVSAAG
ncbi:MAG TPA: hypothetical protein VMO88_03815 [Acidimicrobiales bacterium]|nr:hypothetical protein [Acidimicrobiales bacterium]